MISTEERMEFGSETKGNSPRPASPTERSMKTHTDKEQKPPNRGGKGGLRRRRRMFRRTLDRNDPWRASRTRIPRDFRSPPTRSWLESIDDRGDEEEPQQQARLK